MILGSLAFRVVSAVGLVLCLTECAAEPAGDGAETVGSVQSAPEHCGGVTCNSTLDCTNATPVCAQSTSSTCLSSHECAWKLNLSSSSCPCMEHDVRLCTQSGGSPGVQICTKTSSTSTAWGSCIACPSCST